MRSAVRTVLAVATLISIASAVEAQSLIRRTITINGDMSDWMAAPSVPANSGQSSTDCSEDEACELDDVQSTGRDLRQFAFTWDDDYLYFYVERYASANNTTTWLFYLDEDADGRMESSERIFRVDWWGSNRNTEASLCTYSAAAAGGDPLTGDGATLPGSSGSCTGVYSGVTGGSVSGVQMEARVSWAQLGRSGPTNTRFHISSSRGMNLPSHVEDNMQGPGGDGGGGGQLFPPDLSLAIAAGATQVSNRQVLTLTVTLTNVYYDSYTGIAINVGIPAQMEYVSHTAPGGTSFTDTNADGRPDRWLAGPLGPQQQRQLQISVRGTAVPAGVTLANTAALASWSGTDTNSANNSAAVSVALLPSPALGVTKSASHMTPQPGTVVMYTTLTSNTAHAPAHNVVVDGKLGPHLDFSLDAFGPGVPLHFLEAATPSGLSPGPAEYSADGGVTWGYVPVSGGGGAPAGYDRNVTNWRIGMVGTMNSHGAMFELRYAARVR